MTHSRFQKSKRGILNYDYHRIKHRGVSRGLDVTITFQDLLSLFYDDKKFNAYFNDWVASGYSQKLRPSIDRINPDRGYHINNIQILSYEENIIKGREESKRHGTAVNVYDLEHNFITTYETTKKASDELGISAGFIGEVCRKEKRSSQYIFEYRGDKFRKSKSYNMYSNKHLLEEL